MYMNRHFIISLPILSPFPVLHSDGDTWKIGRERERERDVPMQSSVSMNQCSREKGGNIRRSIFTETSDVVQIPEMPINSLPHARSVQNFGDYEVDI